MLWEKRRNWVKIYVALFLVTQSCLTPLGSSVHGDSSGKNTGLGCHALLQGILDANCKLFLPGSVLERGDEEEEE